MFDTIITDKNYKDDLIKRLTVIAANLEDGMNPCKVCRMIYEQIDDIENNRKV